MKAQHAYEEKKYDDALGRYNDLNQQYPDDGKIQYNLADSYYATGKYPEAANNFLGVTLKNEDPALIQNAFFNLGNSYYQQGKLEEAVSVYKKALELDPDDLAAKQNLEFVQKEIKKRMGQEKERRERQKSGKDKNEDKKEKEKKSGKDEGKKGEQKQEPSKEEEAKKENGKKDRESPEKGETPAGKPQEPKEEAPKGTPKAAEGEKGGERGEERPPGTAGDTDQPMSPEEAERYLNALKEDGAKFMRKQIQAQPGTGVKREKDW